MSTVRELLDKNPSHAWHVHPSTTVFDALSTLADHEIGALMVVDHGKLVGIMSERDYTRKVALQGRNSRETKVADIMTESVLVVSPGTSTRDAMALMSEKKIRHLPVLDRGIVLGMISISDLMDHIISDHELTIAQLESYIHS